MTTEPQKPSEKVMLVSPEASGGEVDCAQEQSTAKVVAEMQADEKSQAYVFIP
jgi:hypothetical protein